MPKDSSGKVLATLGPTTKFEATDTVLSAGRLTTDKIVSYIRDYARLRDELFHTIRQLGLTRNARTATTQPGDYAVSLEKAREELDQKKNAFQEIQSRIEVLEKQIDEARRQVSRVTEVIQAGFSSADVVSGQGEFSRILGRIPARKLADAQRAVQKILGDQAVMAAGNKVKDSAYILLAAPQEKMQQATQTLLLYDFTPTEIPKSDEPNLDKARIGLENKIREDSSELDRARSEMKRFQEQAGESLNQLADSVQDSLMQMQAVLRLGEGAQASKAFAWLTKPLTPRTLSSLSSQGVLYEAE